MLVLTSLIFKQTSRKNRIFLRIFNLVGSLVFIIYGMLIPAYATAIFNTAASLVNIYYLIHELKKKKEIT